ncbi:outer membrane protein assembly factor BamD [bacterium BMS3Abin03]|nr:outer membrane protein assembly factor BamD [bacterium BMS3Abin03]
MKLNLIQIILIAVLFYCIPSETFSQDVDIIPYLKKIESGKVDEVREALPDLKDDYLKSPSVMFLEGVLTENGQEAVVIYQNIIDNYPNSKYADAALYRIYSYYYALGLYESANGKLNQLIEQYPNSPYIKIAKQNRLPSNPEIKSEVPGVDSSKTETGISGKDVNDFKYTIQVGAFSKKENAVFLQSKFEKAGIYSEIREKLVAGTTFHVVYVGKFVSVEDAENFLQTIEDKFKLNGRVTEIPK